MPVVTALDPLEDHVGDHGKPDSTNTGKGGSASGDGQDPKKHGSEPLPTQSGDGKDPNR
ncbi:MULTISPECIES: hypothetical protein [Nocardiopsis]|uniref:Uncharacterized protein n=1 Tax=Nocardiopsis tropica TaxID=109330 RepID=A0ABV1ZQX9_9ACTN|nr:hypothetical protein [Nocardiopsis tropica]